MPQSWEAASATAAVDIGADILLGGARGRCPALPRLEAQLSAIPRDLADLNGHLSPFGKKRLDAAISLFSETWSPCVAGQVNEMQIKLAKFEGAFTWHFHQSEDELLLVQKGRLLLVAAKPPARTG